MSDLNYTLALALEDEFAKRLAREYQYQPVDEEPPIAPSPDPSVAEIKKLVQTSFWASLTKEEGTFHDFRLALMPVLEGDESLFVFRNPLPFGPEKLAKIAPALPPTFRVGVWRKQDGAHLEIWGFAPSDHEVWPLYIEASAGEIIVSLPSGLKGVITPTLGPQFVDPHKVSFVHERSRPHSPSAENNAAPKLAYSSDLREIAKAMRKHEHGGTLLVVPNQIENELDELIYRDRDRFTYECHTYETLKRVLGSREKAFRDRPRREKEAEEADAILPFFDEPSEFVRNQKDSIAIVASQDGVISFLAWDKTMGRVRAIRHAEFVL